MPTPNDQYKNSFLSMLTALAYERCLVVEAHCASTVNIGCVHLGEEHPKLLYESAVAVVIVYGYLVPLQGKLEGDERDQQSNHRQPNYARYVHDLYLKVGEEVIHSLSGTFLILIWDKRQSTLLICNDPLGLRPLYYTSLGQDLLFASEVKALLQHTAISRRLDKTAIANFFHFTYILGERTFFEDIRLLAPGSILKYQDGKWHVKPYWKLSFPDRYPRRSDGWYKELIYNALKSAVERAIQPGLRYGVALSGGLDSRWIAVLLQQFYPHAEAFTFGAQEAQDVQCAALVAKTIDMPLHLYPLSPTYIAEHAEKISYFTDGMYNVIHAHEFEMSKEMSKRVDVAIGGLLGDNLFGRNVTPRGLAQRIRGDVFKFILRMSRHGCPGDSDLQVLFGESQRRELDTAARQSIQEAIEETESTDPVAVYEYQILRHKSRRQNYMGQVAKEPYLIVYHPFADRELINVALQLPAYQKYMERAYRLTLCSYFPELGEIPWPQLSLPPSASMASFVYQQVLTKTAKRFASRADYEYDSLFKRQQRSMDYTQWLRGPLRPFVESVLLSETSNQHEVFNNQGLRTVVKAHLDGQTDIAEMIGLLLSFELWSRMFFEPATPKLPDSVLGPAAPAIERLSQAVERCSAASPTIRLNLDVRDCQSAHDVPSVRPWECA
ncbi:MAG: asparagine synthetase B family protein [Anaerolineae bacterium]